MCFSVYSRVVNLYVFVNLYFVFTYSIYNLFILTAFVRRKKRNNKTTRAMHANCGTSTQNSIITREQTHTHTPRTSKFI